MQLDAAVADVDANLEACERLGDEAGREGAEAIALPEFFTTGVGFVQELADAALAPDGDATELLRSLARRHGALVGGSFLCRDADGEVRNAFLLVTPEGEIAGRHDKDLPTMWENALYVGGSAGDDGVIEADGLSVGAAVCWELMRTQTVRRLAGRIDLALTGSGWWSFSENWPLADGLERRQPRAGRSRPRRSSRSTSARRSCTRPTAASCAARCPGAPSATAVASREAPAWSTRTAGCSRRGTASEGEGVVIAEVEPGRRPPHRVSARSLLAA